jgi:hypothetical protein
MNQRVTIAIWVFLIAVLVGFFIWLGVGISEIHLG